VMLTERGGHQDVVKVLDFGLVKESASWGQLTAASLDAVLGTPDFMAPEAILDPASVDARTDLYALGATAYFLLTGERVFDGANLVEICSAQLHKTPALPSAKRPGLSEALERVVLACLAKKPEDRPKSAGDLAERLVACDLPLWSRADACAWWKEADEARRGKPKKSKGSPHVVGATVTIALDDRAGDDRPQYR
jgi:serine/threonine protein kinase